MTYSETHFCELMNSLKAVLTSDKCILCLKLVSAFGFACAIYKLSSNFLYASKSVPLSTSETKPLLSSVNDSSPLCLSSQNASSPSISVRSTISEDDEIDTEFDFAEGAVVFHGEPPPAVCIHTRAEEPAWDFDIDDFENVELRLKQAQPKDSPRFVDGRWQAINEVDIDDFAEFDDDEEPFDKARPKISSSSQRPNLNEFELSPALLEELQKAQALHDTVFGNLTFVKCQESN